MSTFMRFEEWRERFRPIPSSGSVRGEGMDRYLFDLDRTHVVDAFRSEQPLRVWTLVDPDGTDPGRMLVVEGMRVLCAVGHLITEVPAEEGEAYEVALADREEW